MQVYNSAAQSFQQANTKANTKLDLEGVYNLREKHEKSGSKNFAAIVKYIVTKKVDTSVNISDVLAK